MNPRTRALLSAYFAPHNERLYRLLAKFNVPFTPWEDDVAEDLADTDDSDGAAQGSRASPVSPD